MHCSVVALLEGGLFQYLIVCLLSLVFWAGCLTWHSPYVAQSTRTIASDSWLSEFGQVFAQISGTVPYY